MAPSKAVIVLTPNGRRQTVKVTPDTTILQILEDVCKKQGFKPEEYDLKHHKNILDVNSSIRFSGLPNNAQLEMVTSSKTRLESEVTIAIQLENGNRLIGTFLPGNTLEDILRTLTPDDLSPEKNTVILYMRREIYGLENFRCIDLKSLGITNGRAMLRLIHRSPEELKIQANISAPLPSKPTEEKPYVRKLQKIETAGYPKPLNEENIKTNEVQDHQQCKFLKKDETNSKSKSKITEPQKNNDIVNLIKKEKKKQTSVKRSEPMEIENVLHTGSESNQKMENQFVFLGDRNAMAFSLETAQKVPSEDLPEDFFDLTIDDAKKIFNDLKRRRLELENGQLLTTALRNLEDTKRQLRQLNTYKKSIIRIQFPDRIVLQGTFSTVEDIGTVTDFVRDYLEDKTLDFHLYTTPPKVILNKESRLIDIGCVPGALFHFGTDKLDNAHFLKSEVLKKLTSSSVASMAATKIRQGATRHQTSQVDNAEELLLLSQTDVNVGASTSAGSSGSYVDYDKPSTSSAQEKLPKWLKLSK